MEHLLTAKDRAYLKGLANKITSRYLLGKEEPDDNFFDMLDKALEVKELIKVGILQSSETNKNDLADMINKKIGSQTVQIIGRVIILYRKSKKNPQIQL